MKSTETRASINRLAELTGHDRRTVKKRLESVSAVRGQYEIREVLPILFAQPARPSSRSEAEERLAMAKAEREELRLDRERREFIPKDVILQVMSERYVEIRQRFMGLPGKARAHFNADVRDWLDTEVRQILTDIANRKPFEENEDEDEEC